MLFDERKKIKIVKINYILFDERKKIRNVNKIWFN